LVTQAGRLTGTAVKVVPEPSLRRAESALRAREVGLVFVPGREVLVYQLETGSGSSATSVVASALSQLAGEPGLLGPALAGRSALGQRGAGLPVRGLVPPPKSLRLRLIGFSASVLIYVLLLGYGMRLTIGAHEEKASRVAEVLLSVLRPSQLLIGKVVGMGLLFLAQVAVMLAVAFGAGAASGSPLLSGASPGLLGISAVCLLVGYCFYCSAFAAAGAMVSRQADMFNATLPLQLLLFLPYVLADQAVFAGANLADKVLAFFPATGPVIDPVLFASGPLPAWQFALSAVVVVLGTVALAWLASVVLATSGASCALGAG
jgi:ABC-2 type transport system permease protein